MMTKIENRNPKKSSSIFWGSSVSTAVFVEITPLILSKSQPPPSCSNFTCKHILQKVTLQSCMSTTKVQEDKTLIEWKNESTENCSENFNNGLSCGYLVQRNTTTDENRATFSDVTESFPIYYLPADDSSVLDLQPYCIVVYGNRRDPSTLVNEVIVTPASLMRVLPPRVVVSSYPRRSHKYQDWNKRPNIIISRPQWSIQEDFLQKLSAELGDDFLSDDLEAEVIRNHNPETVRELTLRFSLLLSQLVNIGTTSDAFSLNNQWISQSFQFDHAIQSFCEAKGIPLRIQKQHDLNQQSKRGTHQSQSNGLTSLQWEPSLLIHSPNHADGKTLLAQAIAKRAGCASVHIVRPGALLAKYGIHADAALESLLHSIIISAAVKNKSLCIILDHLDTMMPARLSGRGSDTAAPIFNAIASYLSNITGSLQRRLEFPFPIKNTLYNSSGTGGRVLPARLCLVGIVTCPDDGWRSSQSDSGGSSTIFNSMVGSRYRIPPLTAKTRFGAFSGAFEQAGLSLDDTACTRLPITAASAAWAKGSVFSKVAEQLRQIVASKDQNASIITVQDMESAFACIKSNSPSFAQVTFEAKDDGTQATKTSKSLFESVGGNNKAKASIEDALALDPRKRKMLARFGLSPPTGILLYGPPGTGKTLLAKAVARLLKTSRNNGQNDYLSLGGTFMSLSSSDIVRAEIGTSEKMVMSAFEFADKNAPSVIFFDEFQALFTERSRGGSGKLATTLLQCLDDIKRWRDVENSATGNEENGSDADQDDGHQESNRVVVLAATNTPWMVDSAFLRSGRFDRVVHVGLPTDMERESILRVHIDRMRIRDRDNFSVLESLCKRIAGKTEGFSGADLAALCRAAAIRALTDLGDDGEIEERHFNEALDKDIRASSDHKLVQRLLKWRP